MRFIDEPLMKSQKVRSFEICTQKSSSQDLIQENKLF